MTYGQIETGREFFRLEATRLQDAILLGAAQVGLAFAQRRAANWI
jgi:hypothetical protein